MRLVHKVGVRLFRFLPLVIKWIFIVPSIRSQANYIKSRPERERITLFPSRSTGENGNHAKVLIKQIKPICYWLMKHFHSILASLVRLLHCFSKLPWFIPRSAPIVYSEGFWSNGVFSVAVAKPSVTDDLPTAKLRDQKRQKLSLHLTKYSLQKPI